MLPNKAAACYTISTMKKQSIIWTIVVLVIIAIIILAVHVYQNYEQGPNASNALTSDDSSASVSPVENNKLSSSLSQFQNEELGFSVNYPTAWQTESAPAGVTFVIPDQFPQTTIGTLDASIQVLSGNCAFPPVVTIKDKGTINVGGLTLDTVSMQNSVDGRNYFDQLYSLQKGNVCYMFTFESVTINPTTKGFSTSDVPKINANSQAQIDIANAQFKDVVQSFVFVTPPVGEPETDYHPTATSTQNN
jgi:hypothetical protein